VWIPEVDPSTQKKQANIQESQVHTDIFNANLKLHGFT
jgi:hypothetical protein